jgi:hypothetical protein
MVAQATNTEHETENRGIKARVKIQIFQTENNQPIDIHSVIDIQFEV